MAEKHPPLIPPVPPLYLASSSRFRRELLARLGWPFECEAPDIDERPRAGDSPRALAERLALEKAKAIAARHPEAIVIGSDQVCALGERCLGKPGSTDAQAAMLAELSGQTVTFHTAVAVVGLAAGLWRRHCDDTQVSFRRLDSTAIADYVRREPATDCAAGFKSEGLGISLLSALKSEDPTALIGLPLIWLAGELRAVYAPHR